MVITWGSVNLNAVMEEGASEPAFSGVEQISETRAGTFL